MAYAHTLPPLPPEQLGQFDFTTLVALSLACGMSLHAHVPPEAVNKGIRKDQRGAVRKSLDRLRRAQLCVQHPTRGGTTWQLTEGGLRLAQSLTGHDHNSDSPR